MARSMLNGEINTYTNPPLRGLLRQRAFGYVAILLMLAVVSLMLGVATQHMHSLIQRQKELDWLFAGMQYKNAIASFYNKSPNGIKRLPRNVDELLADPRFVVRVHHLRKAYPDPLTNQPWLLVYDEQRQLIGVRSLSGQKIQLRQALKKNGLDADIQTYDAVSFVFNFTQAIAQMPAENNLSAPISDIAESF